MSTLDPIHASRIAQLCEPLREIVKAELAAGNVVEDSWEEWGFVVLLQQPFSRSYAKETEDIVFNEVNDPHYWKADYTSKQFAQTVACGF
jgi:hypothetical protein